MHADGIKEEPVAPIDEAATGLFKGKVSGFEVAFGLWEKDQTWLRLVRGVAALHEVCQLEAGRGTEWLSEPHHHGHLQRWGLDHSLRQVWGR